MAVKTTKAIIESAILSGVPFEKFSKLYPDVTSHRYRDTKYRLKKKGLLKTEEIPEDIREQTLEAKLKEELRIARLENTRLAKSFGALYSCFEEVKASFIELPNIEITPPAKLDTNKISSTLILPLTDIHVGLLWDGKGGTGQYSPDLFVSRCNTLTEDLLGEIKTLKKSRNLERLIVIFGGDLIDGRTIFNGQERETLPISYQLTVGPEVISRNLLAPLAKEFPAVDVFCVPGNHGRLGEKGQLDKVEDNLDLIFTYIVKLRCEKIKHMVWHEEDNWFSFFNLYGKNYLFTHGDGFSFSGNLTTVLKYQGRLEDTINSQIDVLIAGHHHRPSSTTSGFSHIILMNNWVGSNEFSLSFGAGGPPSQKVILADETNPVFAIYEFLLARHEDYNRVEPIAL